MKLAFTTLFITTSLLTTTFAADRPISSDSDNAPALSAHHEIAILARNVPATDEGPDIISGTLSIKSEQHAATSSSIPERSPSLADIRHGIINLPIGQCLEQFRPAGLLRQICGELNNITLPFPTTQKNQTKELSPQEVYLKELLHKGIWSIAFLQHMTSSAVSHEVQRFLNALLKSTQHQKTATTAQAHKSSASSRTGKKGKGSNASATFPQAQHSALQGISKPFKDFPQSLTNRDQRDFLNTLKEFFDKYDALLPSKRQSAEAELRSRILQVFFQNNESRLMQEEFQKLTEKLFSTSAFAKAVRVNGGSWFPVFDPSLLKVAADNDASFFDLAVKFHVPVAKELCQERMLDKIYAQRYIKILEEENTPEAKFNLGLTYMKGSIGQDKDGQPDYRKAQQYFEESGTPDAKCNLGFMYMEGWIGRDENDQPNYIEAQKYFEESGMPEAKCSLGFMYMEGWIGRNKNGQPDYRKAQQYFEESGTPDAKCNLGFMYMEGWIGRNKNGQPDYRKAQQYFEESGTADAKYHLGFMYMEGWIGRSKNGQPDYRKAQQYFEESGTPEDKFEIGLMYMEGWIGRDKDGQPDYRKAQQYFEESGMPEAKRQLGVMYMEGKIGRDKDGQPDYIAAQKYSEESGTPEAKFDLGLMYAGGKIGRGKDGQPDYRKAQQYFEESGIPEAKRNLGILYLNGWIGRDKDGQPGYQKAQQYFEQSGMPRAKCNLGVMYMEGKIGRDKDGQPDHQKAIFYLTEAQLGGVREAETLLGSLTQLVDLEEETSSSPEFPTACLQKDVEKKEETVIELSTDIKIQKEPETTADDFHEVRGFPETPTQKSRAVRYQKQKKEKLTREQRIQQLKDQIAQEKLLDISSKPTSSSNQFDIIFASDDVKKAFQSMMETSHCNHHKLQELLADIMIKPWGTEGAGQPERLKNKPGCWSRRLNAKDRLVYKVELGKITILECEGHYED